MGSLLRVSGGIMLCKDNVATLQRGPMALMLWLDWVT
jgi:hypothetical protein